MITPSTVPPKDGFLVVDRRNVWFYRLGFRYGYAVNRPSPPDKLRGDARPSLFVALIVATCMLAGACVYWNFFD